MQKTFLNKNNVDSNNKKVTSSGPFRERLVPTVSVTQNLLKASKIPGRNQLWHLNSRDLASYGGFQLIPTLLLFSLHHHTVSYFSFARKSYKDKSCSYFSVLACCWKLGKSRGDFLLFCLFNCFFILFHMFSFPSFEISLSRNNFLP